MAAATRSVGECVAVASRSAAGAFPSAASGAEPDDLQTARWYEMWRLRPRISLILLVTVIFADRFRFHFLRRPAAQENQLPSALLVASSSERGPCSLALSRPTPHVRRPTHRSGGPCKGDSDAAWARLDHNDHERVWPPPAQPGRAPQRGVGRHVQGRSSGQAERLTSLELRADNSPLVICRGRPIRLLPSRVRRLLLSKARRTVPRSRQRRTKGLRGHAGEGS